MIYNNLIYFLVAILVISTNAAPDRPQLSALTAAALFILKAAVHAALQRRLFGRRANSAAGFSAAERHASIMAIVFFSLDIYLLEAQYYLGRLPLLGSLPSLVNLGCLALFMGYLATMWHYAFAAYRAAFGTVRSRRGYVANNIKTNLPIVLPWVCISLFADLLERSSWPPVKALLASSWGEPLVFLCFFLTLALTFPVFITRLWGCAPLPPGPTRRRIEQFCARHRVTYADIMLWPLFEGQAITAGVMGITGRFRYLLITPGLINAMTPEEIEAVMAHEIGHVKRRHLQLYLLLFLGFGTVAQLSSYPIFYALTSSDLFYRMAHLTNRQPGNALALAGSAPMLVLMIIYFRYVMGFFMRNFERQADLFALQAMGDCRPLITVFEKIAWLTGSGRHQPSWHHFSLGERIDTLTRCARDPRGIKAHDRKVRAALGMYCLVIVACALTLWRMPEPSFDGAPREKFAEAVLLKKMEEEPANPVWPQLLGDLQYSRQRYREAIAAYRHTLDLAPDNHETLNNLAWLLLTVDDPVLRAPAEALLLAKRAVVIEPLAQYLDTLAEAYWQNGYPEQAVLAEKRAVAQRPPNRQYYLLQLRKFESAARRSPPP